MYDFAALVLEDGREPALVRLPDGYERELDVWDVQNVVQRNLGGCVTVRDRDADLSVSYSIRVSSVHGGNRSGRFEGRLEQRSQKCYCLKRYSSRS